jgi:hypothetical protein
MSAQNGERARFQRNRKRRVVQRMRLREVLLLLKEKRAANAVSAAAPVPQIRGGPALAGS